MAHFAELDDQNIVLRVIVVSDEDAVDGENFCHDLLGGRWKQTSYNTRGGQHLLGGTPFRKNYAGIGYTYDETLDAFLPPQPYPSWILDLNTGLWNPPILKPNDPNDNQYYVWDESQSNWVLVVRSL